MLWVAVRHVHAAWHVVPPGPGRDRDDTDSKSHISKITRSTHDASHTKDPLKRRRLIAGWTPSFAIMS